MTPTLLRNGDEDISSEEVVENEASVSEGVTKVEAITCQEVAKDEAVTADEKAVRLKHCKTTAL